MDGRDDYSENISDVIEAIQNTDPIFRRQATIGSRSLNMLSGGSIENPTTYPAVKQQRSPYVEIIEQPASKALRFRYECEGRSAGSIPGVNSTPENKTFPSIRIVGYKGRAMVVVSCVTKDPPYKPHPHNLVGKEACKDGFCSVPVGPDSMAVSFAGLGIQCVKKKDIEEALRLREKNKIDPFRTGFEHKRQPAGIDLNSVRLCFEVYLKSSQSGDYRVRLPPVVSDPIFDKKAMSDLVICKLSHCSASVAGGMEMMLLCEKVAKEDIQVRFFEERDGEVWWEGQGDFQPSQVHKQVAIAFRTPSYRDQYAEQPVQVYIQLRRPSDSVTSEPLPFQLLPIGTDDPDFLKRKRQKINNNPDLFIAQTLQAEAARHGGVDLSMYNFNFIKPEPLDNTRSPPPAYTSEMAVPGTSQPPLRPYASPNRTLAPNTAMACMPELNQQQMPSQYQQCPEQNAQMLQRLQYNIPSMPMKTITPDCEPQFSIVPEENLVNLNYEDFNDIPNVELHEFNSEDLAALAEFSSGLSLKDETTADPGEQSNNPVEDTENMTDSLTQLTRSTIQELYTLNKMYQINDNNNMN